MRKSIAVLRLRNPKCKKCNKSLEFIKNSNGVINKACGCK